MIAKRAYTIIEIMAAVFLLGFVMIVFFYLMKTSFTATSQGQTAAAVRETAKTALERIQLELRQAAPVPAGGAVPVPPVILPSTGGPLSDEINIGGETSSVGCSGAYINGVYTKNCIANGASILNQSVLAPPLLPPPAWPFAPAEIAVAQSAAGPSGFLIFSELKQQESSGGNVTSHPDISYTMNVNNYVWVMYQVIPASGTAPAQLVRYTFPVYANGTDIRSFPGGWIRNDAYFVPGNSNEMGNGIPVVSLNNPKTDDIWMMVSHPYTALSLHNENGMVYDPQLFVITSIVQESSQNNVQANAPLETATLSTQVKVEGAGP